MAKKATRQQTNPLSANDLPGVSDSGSVPAAPVYVATPPTPAPKVATVTKTVTSTVLTISVPFISGITGYARTRIDISLSGVQAQRLKGIQMGLESKSARLANGRFVSTPMHAMQWLIENAE